MRALIAVLALVAIAGTATANPRERLGRARDDFRAGKFEDAKHTLNYLLYPAPGRLADPDDIVEAHVLYGVALFETNERRDSTRELEAALYINPRYVLDPQLFSDEAVAFFTETKTAKGARDKLAEEAREIAQQKEDLRLLIENTRVVERRQYWVNFMPFGAGQFQNGQTKKGIFFAATEAAAAGTSIVIFAYLTNKYGYGGQVPREDAQSVRRLQQVSIGANVVFYGVAIVGIVDALRNYKAQAEIELPEDLRRQLQTNPPGDDEETPRRNRAKLKQPEARLHLHPLPFPDGAGVGLTWEH